MPLPSGDERTRTCGVIALTGWVHDRELNARAKEAGVDVVLTKPCLPDALLTKIDEVRRRALLLEGPWPACDRARRYAADPVRPTGRKIRRYSGTCQTAAVAAADSVWTRAAFGLKRAETSNLTSSASWNVLCSPTGDMALAVPSVAVAIVCFALLSGVRRPTPLVRVVFSAAAVERPSAIDGVAPHRRGRRSGQERDQVSPARVQATQP